VTVNFELDLQLSLDSDLTILVVSKTIYIRHYFTKSHKAPVYLCALCMQIRIHESPTTNPAYNMQKSDWETTELLEVHIFCALAVYV